MIWGFDVALVGLALEDLGDCFEELEGGFLVEVCQKKGEAQGPVERICQRGQEIWLPARAKG